MTALLQGIWERISQTFKISIDRVTVSFFSSDFFNRFFLPLLTMVFKMQVVHQQGAGKSFDGLPSVGRWKHWTFTGQLPLQILLRT